MNVRAVIEESNGELRVGDETRPSRFYDHDINGYVFHDGHMRVEGRWSSVAWSDERIREYERAVALKDAIERVYGVETVARWHLVAYAWRRYDEDRLAAEWDQEDPESIPIPDDPPLGPRESTLEGLSRQVADSTMCLTGCIITQSPSMAPVPA